MTNTLYTGVGTSGTVLATNNAAASGANILTTNFDALCIGGNRTGNTSNPTTNYVNQIIVTFTSVNLAGPYFTLTNRSGGSGCGSADIGLNGSVTTNSYMLYTNGVFTGNSLPGTGAPLDFGTQTQAAIYTIVATNTATASAGPMFGKQIISVSAPVITSQPANVSLVTNAPATFTVVATGNALTYQWYRNGIILTNGGDFSGVTTSNLLVSPAQLADTATTANGYSVVVMDTCGDSVTSTPKASLTLVAPNNLVWEGGNPDSTWDWATTANFTNPAGALVTFTYGDNVKFDDTSANTSVTLTTNVTPSLITLNGTQTYSFAGPGSITGFGGLIDNDAGMVTITSTNSYTGGTVISNNATLSLGNGSTAGFVTGVVTVNTNSVLIYNYNNNANIANALAGSGTVNYQSALGGTLTLPLSGVNSNFTGVLNLPDTINVVRVHAQSGSSFPFGNGSTVNVQDGCQAWCDTATFNNIFNIAGNGWGGTTPATGAISVFGSIFTGAINLTANARISGTISGGTILCPITGPYQLEIYGNLGSYVLSIGPTNGVSNYGSTLITSGTVRALNTNAISTGPLTMDVAGDLRLNGFNLTVSNLTSVNTGITGGTGATIQNTGTNNAMLTVGTDGSSTTFDGVFLDGGTAALGLAKIGSGTLTLSAASTNTGTVAVNGGTLALTGSGSFNNAAAYAVASGATLDVSGKSDGTLTLTANQVLKHSGTPVGVISVAGNVNMGSGILQLALNRTNAPASNDTLVVTGTFTPGGTLAVTNLGPALHVGDSFNVVQRGRQRFYIGESGN